MPPNVRFPPKPDVQMEIMVTVTKCTNLVAATM